MPVPDFAIVGAPKCGTTALYHYLEQHPRIFMPAIKEPHFFGRDIPAHHRKATTADDYTALFDEAGAGQLCGEASAATMYSATALRELYDWNPDIKAMAMIRNPVDLFLSFHNQSLRRLNEHHEDPETAWRAQVARARGEDIPPLNPSPEFLQYRDFCSVGRQLQRFVDTIPPDQRLVILYDDFATDTQRVFEHVLAFLELAPAGGEIDFAPRNTSKQRRFAFVEHWLKTYPGPLRHVRRVLKPGLDKLGIAPGRLIRRLNEKPAQPAQISPEFRQELIAAFTPEIETVERLTGCDLAHWYQ